MSSRPHVKGCSAQHPHHSFNGGAHVIARGLRSEKQFGPQVRVELLFLFKGLII